MPSLIAPYTLPSENTTEAHLNHYFSQMYILMGKALYSKNECCNNQLRTIFFPDNSFFKVHSHFPRIFNKFIKFQYFSRAGKTVVIFPGAVGTLFSPLFRLYIPVEHHSSTRSTGVFSSMGFTKDRVREDDNDGQNATAQVFCNLSKLVPKLTVWWAVHMSSTKLINK